VGLLDVLTRVTVVVSLLVGVGLVVVVGPSRLRAGTRNVGSNARGVVPAATVLAAVLATNRVVRDAGIDLSWILGLNVTGHIYGLEGRFVPALQSLAVPPLTAYFEVVYIHGYVFVLVFPVVAFLLHDDDQPLREHLLAYALNYGIGVTCYVAVVAYGPRNFFSPETVESLLYTNWPASQLLTSQVNTNTNVFPSLHASLSTTVALLAYRFRRVYPRWMPIAAVLAASVAVSTMYLGIHWAIDVLGGIALAVGSVTLAARADRDTLRRFWSDRVSAVGRLHPWRHDR
jgi:membrane-associated phospholipid phosphatase